MPTLDRSIEISARHSIFVQRFAGGLANDFDEFAEQLKREIQLRILQENEGTLTGRKLNAMLKDLKEIQQSIYDSYVDSLTEQLELFAEDEGEFELNSIKSVIQSDVDLMLPDANQLWSAATTNPLVFPDSDTTVAMKQFLAGWTASEIKRMDGIIRTGFATGETTDSMARRVVGKGNRVDKATRRNVKNMVRTAVNHVSSQARTETIRQNRDIVIGYEWISVLDDRTSGICRSLSGKEFLTRNKDKEYQPKPPAHVGCRSTIVQILNNKYRVDKSKGTQASKGADGGKQISAEMTYYDFLKTQPQWFQDDVLGKTRGQLFRNGGLTSEEFAKLSTDQKFRPITLAEMRQKAPEAFERAGIDP